MDANNAISIAVPFIAGFEGFSASPYLDAGSYAIGYGNHFYEDGSAVSADDDPISQDDATSLLAYYVAQVATYLAPILQGSLATDNMLAALTDLGYNWGQGAVAQSQLLQLINSGADQPTITAQWGKTAVTSGGMYDSDLYSRRIAEAGLAYSSGTPIPYFLMIAAVAILIALMSTKKRRNLLRSS